MFEPAYYRDILVAPLRLSIKFLGVFFLLFAFVQMAIAAIFLLSQAPRLQRSLPQLRDTATSQFPSKLNISIKDGVATSTTKQPYKISIPSEDQEDELKYYFIMDLDADEDKFASYKTMLLLTDSDIVFPSSSGDVQAPQKRPLSQIASGEVVINKDTAQKAAQSVYQFVQPRFWWIVSILALFMLSLGTFVVGFMLFVGHMITLLVYGLFIWAFTRLLKYNITYRKAYQISLHGSIGPYLLGRFLVLTGIFADFSPYFFFFSVWMWIVLERLRKTKAKVS